MSRPGEQSRVDVPCLRIVPITCECPVLVPRCPCNRSLSTWPDPSSYFRDVFTGTVHDHLVRCCTFGLVIVLYVVCECTRSTARLSWGRGTFSLSFPPHRSFVSDVEHSSRHLPLSLHEGPEPPEDISSTIVDPDLGRPFLGPLRGMFVPLFGTFQCLWQSSGHRDLMSYNSLLQSSNSFRNVHLLLKKLKKDIHSSSVTFESLLKNNCLRINVEISSYDQPGSSGISPLQRSSFLVGNEIHYSV